MLATVAAFVVSAPVSIQLKSQQSSYKVGEPVKLMADATNRGRSPIFLIPQGDGGQSGRKAPYCQIQIRREDGSWQVPPLPGLCGNTNPIRVEDFVSVPPGKSVPLLGDWCWPFIEPDPSFHTPGVVRIRLRYDSTPSIRAWLGGPMSPEDQDKAIQKVESLYEKVPKGVFLSNEIQIRITR